MSRVAVGAAVEVVDGDEGGVAVVVHYGLVVEARVVVFCPQAQCLTEDGGGILGTDPVVPRRFLPQPVSDDEASAT